MANNSDFFDELLAKTDIIKLISQYVPLKKKGSTYWGCCPFHLEKTPSFSVSEQKQLYHCFGCGESGNAITFVKKIENVESFDAIKILAKDAGLEIPKSNYIKRETKEDTKKRERLYAMMRAAARRYNENLYSAEGEAVRSYLKNRGIDKSLATKFGLGYSKNGRDIIAYLSREGYTDQEMKEAALTAVGANGAYDVFADRLIIPIINNFGEVVAFGGRTLKKDASFAKYRNSSNTVIFNKSNTIYAINLLKKLKQQTQNVDSVIMVEGYMDVIALHKAGFNNAVASMGTALTYDQAKQLRNYAQKIFISYDGDSAGQTATLRGLDILRKAGLSVRVVSLPDGQDPDDVISKSGADAYRQLLENAKPLTEFKIDSLKKKYDLGDSEQKSKFTVEAIRVINELDNPVEKEEYLKKIKLYTGYTMETLLKQASISESSDASSDAPASQTSGEMRETAESMAVKSALAAKKFVLAAIAASAPYAKVPGELFDVFADDPLYSKVIEFFAGGEEKKYPSLLYEIVDEQEHSRLSDILHYEFLEGDGAEKYETCVKMLIIGMLEKEAEALIKKYDETKEKGAFMQAIKIREKITQMKSGGD